MTISLMKSLFIQGRSLFRELPAGLTEIQANWSASKKDKFFFKQVILPKFSDSLVSLMRSLFIQGKSVYRKLPAGWTEIWIKWSTSKNKKFFYKEKVILPKLSDSLLFIQGRTAANKYNKVKWCHFSNEVFIYSGKKLISSSR